METKLIVSGKECVFKSSAAIPRIYRIKFGRDIFVDLARLAKDMKGKKDIPFDSLEMFENIAYIMHKHGDPTQPDSVEEWLEQFETLDIYIILPEILKLWKMENATSSVAKKK